VSALAPALQAFFTQRLITQRDASPHTIAAYRDTFRLLLRFAQKQTGKQPFQLGPRGSGRAVDRCVPHPSGTESRQQPPHPQRQARGDPLVLPARGPRVSRTRAHHRADHGDPDQTPPAQHRQLPRHCGDHSTARRARPPHLARPPRPRAAGADDPNRDPRLRTHRPTHRRCPPRRRRPYPRHRQGTKDALTHADPRNRRGHTRLAELRGGQPDQSLFPTRQGRPLSRYTVGAIITRHVTTAAVTCTTLPAKRITPHTLRHTNAMLLRAKGVDIATIALWLGHETTQTTHIYEHADPALKERAIARTATLGAKPGRYRPPDELLAFLEGL